MPRQPEPVWVGDLALDRPLADLRAPAGYERAKLLAWLHGVPVGEVAVPLRSSTVRGTELARHAWAQLHEEIATHLAGDGTTGGGVLSAAGLRPAPAAAPCQRPRREVLAAARPVSVVIATRDRAESLLRCLRALARQTYVPFDVVVVDSAPSSDRTEQALSSVPSWPFELTYRRTPLPGLARAHNVGLRAVTGDLVAFTDDDTEPDPAWLVSLVAEFADPAVACVTGLILPAQLETPAQIWIEEWGGFSRGFVPRYFSLATPAGDPLFPFTAGRFGSGANMAFRTTWLAETGGFDETTGAGTPARGGDDLVAFLRVVLDGAALVYQPAAVVRHWHRREESALRRQAFGYGIGLVSYVAAAVRADRRLAWPMARRSMAATRHLLAPSSEKNRRRGADFPSWLVWRERAGILVGPLAYLASVHRSRLAADAAGRR